jgi:integrase
MSYIVSRRNQGAAAATIRYELAALRRGYALAHRAGRIEVRPYIPTVRVSNARTGFFEDMQVEAIIAALPDPIDDMVRFAAITGWRVSEVMGLTWQQVDRAAGTVRLEVGSTKNGDGRHFPYKEHPDLAHLINWRYVHRMGGFVFHRRGRPVRFFRHSWLSACAHAGVSGRVFHDLRRTAVRNMERASVPRSVQLKLVGLRTESIHRRYSIVNESDLKRGVRLLAGRRNGRDPKS